MSKLNKIKTSIKEKGLIKTIKWLYESLIFRIKMIKRTSLDFTKIENTKDENTYSYPKTLPNVFIVASIPYYDIGGGQRCSQLAKTFNKMGYNVIYLYGYKSSESKKFNLEMPVSSHMFINDKTILEVRNIVKNNDLFIFEAPSLKFKDILNIAISNKCKIVY